jgi:hypothetical protein
MKKGLLLIVAAGSLLLSCAISKKASTNTASGTIADTTKKDTTKKIKPYNTVITSKAITQNGLFKVHKVEDRWFFEIADSLLNKDLLIVNRVSKAAASTFVYGGDWIGENVIQLVKGPQNKIQILRMSYRDIAKDSTDNGLYRSILNSNLQPIVATFDIKAVSPDSSGTVIDVFSLMPG